MTPTALTAAVVSLFTSLVTSILAHLVQESIKSRQRTSRLLLGLCIDAAGSVPVLRGVLDQFDSARKKLEAAGRGQNDDLGTLRALPCAVVVSPPPGLARELVHLLPVNDAREVFHYYDRWDRLFALEERYRTLYSDFLNETAVAQGDPIVARKLKLLREEYWEQLNALIRDIYDTSAEICAISCRIALITRNFPETTEQCTLSELTGGTWCDSNGVRRDCERFGSRRWNSGEAASGVA